MSHSVLHVGIVVAVYVTSALQLGAQQLEVQPSSPSLDEAVIITASFPAAVAGKPRLEVRGLSLGGVDTRTEDSGVRYSWVGTLLGGDTVTVGPVIDANGAIVLNQRRTIEVLAPPAIPADDPVTSFAILKRSRLVPAYVHAEVRPKTPVAGEVVTVTYSLMTEGDQISGAKADPTPAVPGARVHPLGNDFEQTESIPDSTMKKILFRRIAVVPLAAGTTRIGAFAVSASMAPQFIGEDQLYFQAHARRMSPEVVLPVSAPPSGISVVSTGARLVGHEGRAKEGKQSVHVILSGWGDFHDATPPRFSSAPDPRLVVEVDDLGSGYEVVEQKILRSYHHWVFLLSVDEGRVSGIPPLTLRHFDAERGETQELTCEPDVHLSAAPTASASRNRSKEGGAEPAKTKEGRKSNAVSMVRSLGDRYGWIMLVAAVIWVLWRRKSA